MRFLSELESDAVDRLLTKLLPTVYLCALLFVFSLFHTLWGTAEFIDENALQVNFTRLRKTLREIGLEERIETVRGQGYRLKEQVGL